MAVDGLVSGLNTTSIIEQLMQLERLPQDALVARQAKVKAASEAQASIRAKLNTVSSAAAALATATKWNLRTGTTSAASVATVNATNTAAVGSLSFTVDSLATRHAIRSGNVIAAEDAVIASGGSIDLDLGDGVHNLDVGGGTLSEVVSAINASGLRVRAAAVNTGDGYRLQLTSKSSGATSTFSIAGLDAAVGGTLPTEVGADAKLTIGTGPGAYSVTSTTNTFANILPGVTINAVSTSTTPVTVDVNENVDGLAKKVQELVDATNAALLEISMRTAYDPSTKQGASLAGDSTARRAAQQLTRALTDIVGAGYDSVGQVGLQLERTGRFAFDAAKFKEAYTADPAAVRSLFVQNSSVALDPSVTTGNVTFTAAGSRTVAGSYDVVVTQEATQALSTGPATTWPTGAPSVIGVRVGTTELLVALSGTESAEDAADKLRTAITDAGLSLEVGTDGSSLALNTPGYGSNSAFSVAWDGATWTPHQGVDIAGTIGGEAATGLGRELTVPSTTPGVGGLSVNITAPGTGLLGAVSYTPGAAQRVASVMSRALDTLDGYLTTAEKGNTARIKDLQNSIDAFDIRLAKRELRLRTYYSNLEVALSNLQQQSSWLAGQLGGLSANSAK